jgi:NAD(P)-dependent dehydrogenase (short-subunit alcohol dehydrogenase family)
MNLKDRIALVTGANRGLGLGFVHILLEKGARVFATCRDPESTHDLISLQKDFPDKLFIAKMDVTSDHEIDRIAKGFAQNFNKLDLLINNAGVNAKTLSKDNPDKLKNLSQLDRDLLLQMFNINSISPVMIAKSFLNSLRNSENSLIVNISSFRASFSDKNEEPNYGYTSSKVALNMMTKELMIELLPYGINTFAIDPGRVQTDMNYGEGELSILDAAGNIIEVIEKFEPSMNGRFLTNRGNLAEI